MSAQRFALWLIGQAWPIQCVDFGFARYLRVHNYYKILRYANKLRKNLCMSEKFCNFAEKLTFKSKNIGDKITFQSIKHGNRVGEF